jgi:hypothetical protein
MNTLRAILRDLALVTYTVAGVFLCLVLWQGKKALDTVNAPKSGTLAMVDDTIMQGRLTIDATNKVLIHEQNQLGTFDGYARNLDSEVSGLASHANTTLDALSGSATAATQTLNTASTSLQSATDHLTPVLDAATSTTLDVGAATKRLLPIEDDADASVKHFDTLLASPDIPLILSNSQKITASGAVIIRDGQIEADRFTFPPKTPWYKKIVPTALKAGELVWDFER